MCRLALLHSDDHPATGDVFTEQGCLSMQYKDQNQFTYNETFARDAAKVNVGLRTFMLNVYNNMMIGLGITALVALGINMMAESSPAFARAFYSSPIIWIVIFAPLAFIFLFNPMSGRMSASGARMMFFLYSAFIGASMSTVLLLFTHESVVQVFFITAASFGALSLWGYTTKRDLSAMGSFMTMGLFGILLAMVANIFLGSSAVAFAVSVLGVLVFAGLTAWDTAKLKQMYLYQIGDNGELAARFAVVGALILYLDFINMFYFLLHLLGNRE
jgi:FtsH-binding integral membrane protein